MLRDIVISLSRKGPHGYCDINFSHIEGKGFNSGPFFLSVHGCLVLLFHPILKTCIPRPGCYEWGAVSGRESGVKPCQIKFTDHKN